MSGRADRWGGEGAEGKPFEVPEGYQLVTLDQVLKVCACACVYAREAVHVTREKAVRDKGEFKGKGGREGGREGGTVQQLSILKCLV